MNKPQLDLKRPGSVLYRTLTIVFLMICGTFGANAQAPTSLQYPTPNAFIANVTSVYLAPTLSAPATTLTYSINPALPAGLSFDPSTGVIAGVPTAVSAATTYTVTVTNAQGSTTAGVTITVTTTTFNNNFDPVSFNLTDTLQKAGNGLASGNIILYRNVSTLSGQAIDCIVTTRLNTNATFTAYDQNNVSGGGYNNNLPRFFSPQVTFPAGGGSIIYDFQFILGGSYNNATNTGTNVTLQGVNINVYDIDGNGNAGSNQFSNFSGFDTSRLSQFTTITPSFNTAANLTQFRSQIDTNRQTITSDTTRIKLSYKNLSDFTVQLGSGANGAAYFFLDFSFGPAFASAVPSTPPTIDLDVSTPGINNGSTGCSGVFPFTVASQTNAASGTDLSELRVYYKTSAANLPDGANERLVIGAASIPLNFSTGGTGTVTVGATTYNYTRIAAGAVDSIAFVNAAAATFTLAQAEALLDALSYQNIAASRTAGSRSFGVNIRNTIYVSPTAVFTATIGCVGISGNIYHDANGLTDNLVNSNSTNGALAAGAAYAILTNQAGLVLASQPIAADGSYNFNTQVPGSYIIAVSSAARAVNSTYTTPTYPGTYISTGENLGSGPGSDKLVDGKIRVVLGTVSVTNANLGIQTPPTTTNTTLGNQINPGGFNNYTIPSSAFAAADLDGTVDSLTITAFPAGANYIRIGTTVYTNGGSCPPQSSCVAWPGTVTIPYNQANTISVDPAVAGATSVSITYTVKDNGGAVSNQSTVTIPFVASAPISVSGNVWNDINGDGVKAAAENYLATAGGNTLYAMLVQTSNTYSGAPTVYASVAVTAAANGYTFNNVPQDNTYEIRIVSATTAPVAGVALSTITPSYGTNFTGVSTIDSTVVTGGLNTVNLVNLLGTVTKSITNVNFGIEQAPAGASYTAAVQLNPGGTTQVPVPAAAFTGSDAEDGAYAAGLAGRRVTLTAGTNSRLFYGATLVTTSLVIPSFDPSLVSIDPTGATPTVSSDVTAAFSYQVADAAGIFSPAYTVTMPFAKAINITGNVWNDANGDAVINAGEAFTNAGGLNAVLTDAAGTVIETVPVNASGAYTFTKGIASQNYKIVLSTTSPAAGATLTTSALPLNATYPWVNTGVNPGGSSPLTSNKLGILSVTTPAAGDLTNQNFGIEQTPAADPKAFNNVSNSSFSSTSVLVNGQPSRKINGNSSGLTGPAVRSLSGTDPEDCAAASTCAAGKTFQIQTIKANTALYYNSGSGDVLVTPGTVITNFNAANLTIYGQTGQGNTPATSFGFTYSLTDAAGVVSPAVTYNIQTSSVVPVRLVMFTATAKKCVASLTWKSATDNGSQYYDAEQSTDGIKFFRVTTINSLNNAAGSVYEAHININSVVTYYRLKMTDADGSFIYSNVLTVRSDECNNHELSITPNPAVNTVRVSGLSSTSTVTIFDLAGKAVTTFTGVINNQTIDVSNLLPGTYILKAINKQNEISTVKFIHL